MVVSIFDMYMIVGRGSGVGRADGLKMAVSCGRKMAVVWAKEQGMEDAGDEKHG
jgi:hypothetical protein